MLITVYIIGTEGPKERKKYLTNNLRFLFLYRFLRKLFQGNLYQLFNAGKFLGLQHPV